MKSHMNMCCCSWFPFSLIPDPAINILEKGRETLSSKIAEQKRAPPSFRPPFSLELEVLALSPHTNSCKNMQKPNFGWLDLCLGKTRWPTFRNKPGGNIQFCGNLKLAARFNSKAAELSGVERGNFSVAGRHFVEKFYVT